MQRILSSLVPIIEKTKHVTIDEDALQTFVKSIKTEELADTPPFFEKDDNLSLEQSIAFGFVYNAINFSYWGEPKWTVEVDGEKFDGGIGLLRVMQRGITSGYELLSAEYLKTLPKEDLQAILKANIEIPMFNERLQLLRSLGKYIADNYDSSFTAFVDKSGWDAVKLVEQLADEMPDIFNDEEAYDGVIVRFYKRAQLLPSHLYDLKVLGVSDREVTNMDKLTALADYKIPQLLRKHGVLKYTDDLANRVDSLTEIANGSEEEIEIRAMTVWAVELIAQQLEAIGQPVTAIQLDHMLWLESQAKSPDDKPYHRTRTINY